MSGEEKGVKRKALMKIRQQFKISDKDVQLLARLRKKDGSKQLVIADGEGERELTDEEKVEVSRILYSVTMKVFANKLKGMSSKQAKLEAEKLLRASRDEERQGVMLDKINNII